jgi:hypothetical protein
MTVKDDYEKLRKRFNLPSFDEIDAEFDLAGIEEGNLLREIRHRVHERLEFGAGIIDTICQPDANNMRSMMECGFFNDQEKTKAFHLSQRLMVLWRSLTEAELLNDEKSDVEAIKLAFKEWKEMKEPLLAFIRKMKESWKHAAPGREDLGYLG